MKVRLYFCFYALLMVFASLFSGCSADDSTPSEAADDEIRLTADVWRVMEGTRATFINGGDVDGSFKVYAYTYNTTAPYITGEIVNYSSGVSSWVHPQVWPRDNSALDFFAYMPTDLANTCCTFDYLAYDAETNTDGYSAGNPRIVCASLPMTNSGQSGLQEFVYAYTMNQNKAHQGESGVTMTFKRPFARIKMQLSSTQADIHINSITFNSLKNNGTCSFDGTTSTWTPSGDAANFVATLNSDYTANAGLGTFIMIPQSWTGAIDVNITWDNWGTSVTETLSTTVPTVTWLPGYSYTYTFTINKAALIVDIEKFTEQW